MSGEFWLGVAVSIPISIGCNLAVPSIQRWWQRRGDHSQKVGLDQKAKEYTEVLFYALHPELMIASFVIRGMAVTLYAVALISLDVTRPFIQGVAFYMPAFDSPPYLLLSVIGVAVIVLTFPTVFFVTLVYKAASLYNHVRHFGGYIKSLPAEIRDTNMENAVNFVKRNKAFSIALPFKGDNPEVES